MTGDEHALSFREQVTDQISDGVRFSCTGRSLYQDPTRMLEPACDPELLGISRLAEEDVVVLWRSSTGAVCVFEIRRRFEAHDIQKRPG